MGDGEYEFADDGKLFKPPTVKLLSAKLKSAPAKGVVSNYFRSTYQQIFNCFILAYRVLHKESIWFQKVMEISITNISPK